MCLTRPLLARKASILAQTRFPRILVVAKRPLDSPRRPPSINRLDELCDGSAVVMTTRDELGPPAVPGVRAGIPNTT